MSAELVRPPDTGALRQEITSVLREAVTYSKIVTLEEHDKACAFLTRVTRVRNGIIAAFMEPKKRAWEAHKAITKLEADLLAQPAEARRIVDQAVSTYRAEAEKKRREEQAKLQEITRRQEEDRRMAEAEALANTGHVAEAEALLDAPVTAPMIELPKPEQQGVSVREQWDFEIIDADKIERPFLLPNEVKIRALVRALGTDAESKVGGIRVFKKQIVAVRS